jgi:glycosyltransferase involved in cell wall biosynthesis
MYLGHRISVIIPAYNEEETIAEVVRDFKSHAAVDEVLVVDNNCRDATAERANAAGARVVRESAPGYGCALRCGLDASTGDWLVLVEADGSFRAHDLDKFLCYLPDANLVMGTRTTRQMVQQGANMPFHLRWGNVVAAKILEFLWYVPHEPRLTDVGCTYRAMTRDCWNFIRGGLTESGPAFSPEVMCETLRHGLRIIEIPVHYFNRAGGSSKHSKNFAAIARTALKMLRAIFRKRIESSVPRERRAEAARLVPDKG